MIGYLDKDLQPNERIIYTYTSVKNGTKATMKKHGVFIAKVKHRRKYWTILHRKQKAIVKFFGNESETRVLYNQLKRANP